MAFLPSSQNSREFKKWEVEDILDILHCKGYLKLLRFIYLFFFFKACHGWKPAKLRPSKNIFPFLCLLIGSHFLTVRNTLISIYLLQHMHPKSCWFEVLVFFCVFFSILIQIHPSIPVLWRSQAEQPFLRRFSCLLCFAQTSLLDPHLHNQHLLHI